MKGIEQLAAHPLFQGISPENIKKIKQMFSFKSKHFRKNEYILMEGDEVLSVGIILEGEILMEKEDRFGEGWFFTKFQSGSLFGDIFMSDSVQKSTVNYKALTDCEVVLFRYHAIWEGRSYEPCYLKFMENLMALLAMKTRHMLEKVEILSNSSLRQRILTCIRLNGRRRNAEDGVYCAELPFNKSELAEYLCVNRSALMRELGRMKSEGLLACEGKVYKIWQTATNSEL